MTDHPVHTNPEVGFEKEDVNATSLIKFLLWLVVATVAIVFLLWRLYFVFVAQEAARQPPPPIMKPTAAQMAPPGPLLQVQPEPPADLATRFANQNKGDLFISVHCNSGPSKVLSGVETYTLNTSSDRYSMRLAARENASTEKGVGDLS